MLRETDQSASPRMEVLREQFRLLAEWSGFAAIVSGIVWFWIVLARMTGGSLREMPRIDSIGVAITQTQFGRLWTWRLGLMLCLQSRTYSHDGNAGPFCRVHALGNMMG